MGTTLTGTTPQDTYDSLIKVTDNGPLTGSLKKLTDGLGNDSALSLSTTAASLSGNLTSTGSASFTGSVASAITPSEQAILQGGYLQFYNAAATNKWIKLTDDASTIDAIGFSKSGAASTIWFPTGNVGIGTDSPTVKLESSGAVKAASVAFGAEGGYFLNFGGNAGSRSYRIVNDLNSFGDFVIQQSTTQSGSTYADRLAISATGNVGIGTSAPESKLHVAGSAAGSDVTLYIDNAAGSTLNNSSRLKFSSDSGSSVSGGGAELNCLVVTAVNGAVDLLVKSWTGGAYTEKARFLAGGGLTFNGDTAAANALDDYEEGTFTPNVAGDATGAFGDQRGEYTKIGNVVHFRLIASISSNFTSNAIGGLPFTVGGAAALSGISGNINVANNNTSNLTANIEVGGTAVAFYTDHNTSNLALPSTTMGILRMFGTYRV
jgi:hypothetical protein